MWLDHVITYNGFELESPDLHQICILGFSQLVFKMGIIDIDLQGHLPFRLKKQHSTSPLHTALGQQGALYVPNVLLSF